MTPENYDKRDLEVAQALGRIEEGIGALKDGQTKQWDKLTEHSQIIRSMSVQVDKNTKNIETISSTIPNSNRLGRAVAKSAPWAATTTGVVGGGSLLVWAIVEIVKALK